MFYGQSPKSFSNQKWSNLVLVTQSQVYNGIPLQQKLPQAKKKGKRQKETEGRGGGGQMKVWKIDNWSKLLNFARSKKINGHFNSSFCFPHRDSNRYNAKSTDLKEMFSLVSQLSLRQNKNLFHQKQPSLETNPKNNILFKSSL